VTTAPRGRPRKLPEPEDRKKAIQAEIARLEREAAQTERLYNIRSARDKLIPFAQVTMPDVNKPDDPNGSRYMPARHHLALAAALEQVEAGEWLNLMVSMPPRHGKTELTTKRMLAWFVGRDPTRSVAVGTYSDDLAGDIGRDVRALMEMPLYREMFPGAGLRKGSKSADRMQTEAGGMLFFVGRGTGITGRGADLIVIDDPFKNRAEADSKATRDAVWKWWQDDISTRILDEGGRFVIVMTRWHEDDLIGRLTDPNNPHFIEEEAKKWRMLDLPALAREGDPLGRNPGEALWPERFGVKHLEAIRTRSPRTFSALYQGRPTPEEGDDFKADWLKTYTMRELPSQLKMYAASDLAVETKTVNDKSCFGVGGVCENGILWIMPDLEWGRFPPDDTVDRMIRLMKARRPLHWWAEGDHINKAIGPFLRTRMREERVWCVVEGVTVRQDKRMMATTARGMLQAGMVRFPAFTPWWADAKEEMLKFPNATHDDFVSFLSHLCNGVDRFVRAKKSKFAPTGPRTGTIGWITSFAKDAAKAKRDVFNGY